MPAEAPTGESGEHSSFIIEHSSLSIEHSTFRNMKSLLFLFFLLLAGCAMQEEHPPLTDLTPIILERNGTEWFQYWEIPNGDYLWQTDDLGQIDALQAYRDSVQADLGEAFTGYLEAQSIQHPASDTVLIPGGVNPDSLLAAKQGDGDRYNYDIIHYKEVGEVRPINYLEAQILNYQLDRYPLFSHPTEFHGFILTNDSLDRVRVYYAASDAPWPPKPKPVVAAVEQDLQQGWELTIHLHNHYEPAEDGYLGTMAPSMSDAQYFKGLSERFRGKAAHITNGFHTVVLPPETYGKFAAYQ